MSGLGDSCDVVGLWTLLSPKILERQVVAIPSVQRAFWPYVRLFLVLSDPCIVYRPQTQGEEELQLQLALAMSRQETSSYTNRCTFWPLWTLRYHPSTQCCGRIRTGYNVISDPDPAFEVNANPDPDPLNWIEKVRIFWTFFHFVFKISGFRIRIDLI